MLSAEDNDLICRVGRGTPMGELMRQYWVPALRSDELPAPDCPPVRVRLLGENLVAFRATSGRVGLVQNSCPHRGASLFFGRNEEEGLRCVYHGWKFDVTGACVDMPSEPAESNFKAKVWAAAYPCLERNGTVWAYMGPRETPPPLPAIEANMASEGQSTILTVVRDSNWLQAIEGDIDTSHAGFLHWGSMPVEVAERSPRPDMTYLLRTPLTYSVRDAVFGTSYAANREAEADSYYWRMASYIFPFYSMAPQNPLRGLVTHCRAWVPIDDEHSMFWTWNWHAGEARGFPAPAASGNAPGMAMLPNTSDWMGRFRLVANRENDYLIDREVQRSEKSGRGFTGIEGVHLQDQMITEAMGPIYNRSREHLGTTDAMIIRTRRRIAGAVKAYRDHGALPENVDNQELFRVRTGWVVLPRGADFWEATERMRGSVLEQELEATPQAGTTR